MRAGRECVTSPVRVVWVWVWAAVCAVSCVHSRCARHVKGRAQCKLLLSLRVLLHIDCAYGVYSLAGLTGYSAYTLLPSLAPYLVQISLVRTLSRPGRNAVLAPGMPTRRVWLLVGGAALLLNVWRLVARQGDDPEVAAACSLARQLELAPPPSETGSDAADDEVRLFWWHRFEGHRRSVRTPQKFTCADGLRCVSDSRASAFAAAHGVVIWSGPDHRRGECLPPQRPAHTWVLEFSEPPTVDARTEAELYSEAFAQRFEVKVRPR